MSDISPDPSTAPQQAVTSGAAPDSAVAMLQQQLDSATNELDAFRCRVRERAIRGFREGNWTLQQLNESLSTLELEPFEPTYIHHATASINFTVRIDEPDYDRARDALRFLQTDHARQALQESISAVLQTADGPTLSAQDLTTHTDHYLSQITVD